MYKATIGLEVHAELKIKSKMFCGCPNNPHSSQPNQNICPVCMAHPGTLPVPNKEAILSVLKFGVAVQGELATYSEFDRKNYFYPDIPKAYQLSQYAFPFVQGGKLAEVELTRVHLEEDTARSSHDKSAGSLVDYNRAGVPLMELVTEPVIHDAKTAVAFAKELQMLLRTLGISDANMEKGEMRVEANISVSNTDTLGTKVEVKNLNSFKSVEGAIQFEIARQVSLYESGGSVVQETRGWDESRLETYLQRTKETAKDYRYFPDPDIPKYKINEVSSFSVEKIAENLPLLPSEKRLKYENLGLPSAQIETLIQNIELDNYFAKTITNSSHDAAFVQLSANYFLTDLAVRLNGDESDLSPDNFSKLIAILKDGTITSRVAKDLLAEFANNNIDLTQVVNDRNLSSKIDLEAFNTIIDSVIAAHESVVVEYKAGKEASLQFLIGQVMKATKGTAAPDKVKASLMEVLAR